MIKARAGDLFVFGLEEVNIERLQAGQPIHFDLAELGAKGKVLILYGRTKKDIQKTLNDAGFQNAWLQ